MAKKRMFSLQIVDTDAFLDMPTSTQNLYFHLCMRADDDGFISNPKKITKMVNASDDDLKVLFTKRFILGFDNGIIVIKHWKIHNYIAKDRYTETTYLDEKNKLQVKENKSYTECIRVVDNCDTQVSIDKVSIDKVSKKKKPTQKKYLDYDDIKEYRDNIKLREKDYNKLINDHGLNNVNIIIDFLSNYKLANGKHYDSDYGAINMWVIDAIKEKGKYIDNKKDIFDDNLDDYIQQLEEAKRD